VTRRKAGQPQEALSRGGVGRRIGHATTERPEVAHERIASRDKPERRFEERQGRESLGMCRGRRRSADPAVRMGDDVSARNREVEKIRCVTLPVLSVARRARFVAAPPRRHEAPASRERPLPGPRDLRSRAAVPQENEGVLGRTLFAARKLSTHDGIVGSARAWPRVTRHYRTHAVCRGGPDDDRAPPSTDRRSPGSRSAGRRSTAPSSGCPSSCRPYRTRCGRCAGEARPGGSSGSNLRCNRSRARRCTGRP
jgi:hypothetical protein